jgi:hypothetical protein
MEEMLKREEKPRQFIGNIAHRLNTARLNRVDFMFLAGDIPEAVTYYVDNDESYAIGLDHSWIILFSTVFSSLLHARLKGEKSLYWVMSLHDTAVMSFANKSSPEIDNRILKRGQEQLYLQGITKKAEETAEQFLIAHELGHIHLNHFQTKKALRIASTDPDTKEDVISRFEQSAEYEADDWAAHLLEQIAGDDPLEKVLAYHVPSIYLGIVALLNQLYVPRDLSIYLGIFELKKQLFVPLGEQLRQKLMDSHPEPWSRAERLEHRIPTDETGPADPLARALADLRRLLARERTYPPFRAAAAKLRARLEEAPPHPKVLQKKVSEQILRNAYVFSLERFARYRHALGRVNVFYYGACVVAVWLSSSYLNSSLTKLLFGALSLTGFGLAGGSHWAARRANVWRAHIYAVGEAVGIMTGAHVSQLRFLLKISSYLFAAAAIGLILLALR